jgi:hypothetical protein
MEGNNIYRFWPVMEKGYKQKCQHLFDVCGCSGKAWAAVQGLSPKFRAPSKTEA